MLSVCLLGSPQLQLDDRPVDVPRRKSRALIYYLAAHAEPLTRDHLLALFWPDSVRSAAQQTLRTTLHGLRKILGAPLIVEGDRLAVGQDSDVDVRRFAAVLQPPLSHLPPFGRPTSNVQSLTSTLQLYRGDFLDGFTLRDTPAFDDWAAAERERYRRLAVRGLTALSRAHESGGDYRAALDALARALEFDPLQEDLQRDCMRLQYLAGDRPGAIRRYDTLRKLLDREMGVPPMTETRAVYDSIINDTLEIPNPKSQIPKVGGVNGAPVPGQRGLGFGNWGLGFSLPFTGRTTEMLTLRVLFSQRPGRVALIEGEAGIGKSRLAAEFICDSDAILLHGAARELEQALPYQPIIEALRGLLHGDDWPTVLAGLRTELPAMWLNELARLLPEILSVETPGPGVSLMAAEDAFFVETPRRGVSTIAAEEARLWEGVNQFLLALARRRAVIFFVDDLHWADASTLGLLSYLARQAAPVFFVLASRPIAPRSPLAALAQTLTRQDRLVRVTLSRLSDEEVQAIARHLSATEAGTLADWLWRASEGNPYILVELIRHAREANILRPDGSVNGDALPAAPVLPQTVYSLIQSRLARLSDSARRVLDAAVAVGREFDFRVAVEAAALSESAGVDALDELQAAGLIVPRRDDPAGRLYLFDHSLTMEVAYREVGETRHRLLHRRVAESIENNHRKNLDAVAGLLASHYSEGDDSERAAHFAYRAGQLAAWLAAWAEAIAFFEQALAAESGAAKRQAILIALGEARTNHGAAAQASDAFRAAFEIALGRGDLEQADLAQLALARSFLRQARFAEAIAGVREVLARGRSQSFANAEFTWGTALSLEGADLASAVEHLQKAEAAAKARLAERDADPATLAQIKFELGSVAAQQGDLAAAIALYREALAFAQASESEDALNWLILANNNLAYHLHLSGDSSAGQYAVAGLSLAREHGLLGLQAYLLSTSGEIAMAAGDLEAAERSFLEGLAVAERTNTQERVAGLTANLGLVAARRGELPLAIHRLSTALTQADALGTCHLAAQVRLWLAPLLPPAEARARLAEARAIAESGGRRRLLEEIARLEFVYAPVYE